MYKYKLLLAYDGTPYGGWQIQSNSTSIQSLVQEALSTVVREPVFVVGSGRTDAGVHARGQTAHFAVSSPLDPTKTLNSLNGLLPSDIRGLSLSSVSDLFHARYSSIGKTYHYHLHLDRVADPFTQSYRLHVMHKVDLSLLKQAAHAFLGTHDFTSFANQPHLGSASRDPVRTLRRLGVVEQPGGVRLEFEGDGFLYKMVRNIVGTLLEVGGGKRSPEEIPAIFAHKDRKRAGRSAEPHGLFLMNVDYPKEFS